MSSDSRLPVPSTGVPIGIADPVVKARTELKAALAAIENKANLPRRISRATDERLSAARSFARKNPGVTVGIVVTAATLVGTAVWGLVRLYTR